MSNFRSSCSAVFVCSAILCWNPQNLTYSFSNFTRCTPNFFYFRLNVHLIPQNEIEQKSYANGLICSNCQRKDFLDSHHLRSTFRCHNQRIRIQLKNYCHYFPSKSTCQCHPSNTTIQFPNDWIHALVPSGKGDKNVHRFVEISQSGSLILYLLMGLLAFVVVLGGLISMISMKWKSRLVK